MTLRPLAWALAAGLLAGCGTPAELTRPTAAPVMAPPAQPNPLPPYAVPDPQQHP
ncbi:MAG TPA: hypothetical protein VG166_00235 [Caulobacteraceae bacterium]|nr:hypothetical protein [Caulobacteraceae bacterium]